MDGLAPSTLDRVIEIVSEHSGISQNKLSANSAIDQDVCISGGDVEDLVMALAAEYGNHVSEWSWHRFAELREVGVSPLVVFQLVWCFVTWPIRGSFSYPIKFERLELGHIAAVLDRGEWFEP